jgi:ABC-2 type transport system permease protein
VNPRKLWLIAKREYLVNFRRKSFLFTAFGMPIFIVVMWVVVFGLVMRVIDDTSGYTRVGVVDQAGIFASQTPEQPFELMESPEVAARALENKEIVGYYVIPTGFLSTPVLEAYYRQTQSLNEGLRDELGGQIREALSAQISDPQVAERLQSPLGELKIFRAGSDQELDEAALIVTFLAPVFVGILMFILTMTTSQFLMSGLIEEKENRMMELFITSARPSEMLWGKMIGMGLLGLTQLGIWAGFGVIVASLSGTLNLGRLTAAIQFSPELIFVTLVFTILGFVFNGSIQAAIGATANAEQEGRQISSIVVLPSVIPLALMVLFIMDPNGAGPVLMSMIPFTAPVAMILRAAMTTVPFWQILLSAAILFVTVLVLMQLAARIFRAQMLNYGKRPSIREIWRAMLGRQPQMITSTAQAKEVGA